MIEAEAQSGRQKSELCGLCMLRTCISEFLLATLPGIQSSFGPVLKQERWRDNLGYVKMNSFSPERLVLCTLEATKSKLGHERPHTPNQTKKEGQLTSIDHPTSIVHYWNLLYPPPAPFATRCCGQEDRHAAHPRVRLRAGDGPGHRH